MLHPYFQDILLEAGCDEAGRGCLAGPVFAAAVILPKDFFHPLLNDSKQLTEKERDELRPQIEQQAVAYAVASLCNKTIDKINILQASFKSMHQCIIQGDVLYASIAAASVLAKTYRDEYMKDLHLKYPQYNWIQNKGYGTRQHQEALHKYGPCRYHRTTFRLCYTHTTPEENKIVA